MPIQSLPQTQPIAKGTTVVSSTLRGATLLSATPTDSADGIAIQPRTALKVVGYRAGWHKVETLAAPKTPGWVSTTKGPTLAPQLTVPVCDRNYVKFDKIDGKAFTGPVKISDINQGYLGDCYLIAALTALAHSNPEAIQSAIREGDEPGSYIVTLRKRLKVGGRTGPKSVKVDDWFPIKDEHMLYAQGGSKDEPRSKVDQFKNQKRPMWPAIIEKAVATMAGGYHKVEGGLEEAVFEAFTGKPSESCMMGKFGSYQNQSAIKFLKQGIRSGRPVAVATRQSKDGYSTPNLHSNHVYVAVADSQNKVVLRNPHDPRDTMAISYDGFSEAFERITIGG